MSIKVTLATIAIIVALASIATNGFINSALGQQTFTAELTGGDEVPPVDTEATGTFNLVTVNQSSGYLLSINELANATAAHIHRGEEGVNGKIVVTLYNATMPASISQGLLKQGNITSSDLVGPLKGQPLSALVDIMTNGTAYVNVHTKDFPLGEIRGELSAGETEDEG